MKIAKEINDIVQKVIEDIEDAKSFQDKQNLIYGLLDSYDAIICKYRDVWEKEKEIIEAFPKIIKSKEE